MKNATYDVRQNYGEHKAVFGTLGSVRGVRGNKRSLCQDVESMQHTALRYQRCPVSLAGLLTVVLHT